MIMSSQSKTPVYSPFERVLYHENVYRKQMFDTTTNETDEKLEISCFYRHLKSYTNGSLQEVHKLTELLEDVAIALDMPYDELKMYIGRQYIRAMAIDRFVGEQKMKVKVTKNLGESMRDMKDSIKVIKDYAARVTENRSGDTAIKPDNLTDIPDGDIPF